MWRCRRRDYFAAVIAEEFLDCAEAAAALIDSDAVAAAWDAASALEGYAVGGLAGHLARAVLTVERYLDQPSPPGGADLSDAAGYFTRVLGDHDPLDSQLHRSVRDRGAATASDGPAALSGELRATLSRLRERLDAERLAAPVQVLDDVTLTVADYLETRLVELVVHLDDLAVSVGLPGPPPLPERVYQTVAGTLGRVAADRAGGLETVRSLARTERHPGPVRAL